MRCVRWGPNPSARPRGRAPRAIDAEPRTIDFMLVQVVYFDRIARLGALDDCRRELVLYGHAGSPPQHRVLD